MGSRATGVFPQGGEVVIPHDAEAGPLSAVRNNVLQTSLALLRDQGLYERYAELVPPDTLHHLLANVTPCWVPMDLVHSHYRACDAMQLSPQELEQLGQRAGENTRKVSIVVAQPEGESAFDVWANADRMHRVWKRLYQGGSVGIARLSPNEELVDFRGYTIHQHRYFRYGCVAAIRSAHEAVGVPVEVAKIVRYDQETHELTVHLSWK